MTPITRGQAQKAIALVQTELGKSLTAAFTQITGDSSVRLLSISASLAEEFAWIRNDFEPLAGASLYLGLRPADRLAIGYHLLAAKKLEGNDDFATETLHETLMQGVSALSSLLAARS